MIKKRQLPCPFHLLRRLARVPNEWNSHQKQHTQCKSSTSMPHPHCKSQYFLCRKQIKRRPVKVELFDCAVGKGGLFGCIQQHSLWLGLYLQKLRCLTPPPVMINISAQCLSHMEMDQRVQKSLCVHNLVNGQTHHELASDSLQNQHQNCRIFIYMNT